jgi:hypothetical protein
MADKKCRRCHECRDSSHHWIPNPQVGITDEEPEWTCKHCPKKGGECPCCCGYGEVNAPDGGPQCHICKGEGVLPLKAHRALKDASEKAARSIMEQWESWEADAGQESQRHQMPEAGSFLLQSKLQCAIEDAIFEVLK